MVKCRKHGSKKSLINKEQNGCKGEANKIGANTHYEFCSQRLSAYGGLLPLEKFLDMIKFQEVFERYYKKPVREVDLGDYKMVYGFLMLLFIGFQRTGHFQYIREDPLLCGLMGVKKLPAVSTFWRYLQSLGLNQSGSLLDIMAVVRSRVWQTCAYAPSHVDIDIDPTVTTVYGDIFGARKGHNAKHRGKKGLRPVLAFIQQTREYICGKQRKGETLRSEEVARIIKSFDKYLPSCVKEVLVRGDGEHMGWESVAACYEKEYFFIIANKGCKPPFSDDGWYKHGDYEYNECVYRPIGWSRACRFVVMRIRKEQQGTRQLKFIAEYSYRIFVTNLKGKAHRVIKKYDKRADCENLIGEAQREGIKAIPSKKFACNHAYFQIVMMAYNLWRWIKLVAGTHEQENDKTCKQNDSQQKGDRTNPEIVDNTARIARLKMLFVAAKISDHSNRYTVYYSIHDSRTVPLSKFMKYLDRKRKQKMCYSDMTRLSALKKTG